MSELTFRGTVEPFGPAGAFVLTDAQVASLGGGRRAPLVVRVGERSARLRLAVMGGQNVIGLSKASRAELAVDLGDTVDVTVALDEQPREVEPPAELAAALAQDESARTAYTRLAYTHRKEYAVWVGEAKRPETRLRRAEQALQMLREGRTRS